MLVASGRIARAQGAAPALRFLLGAITALLVVAVAISFRTLNGLAAGTALLVVMGALKLLESRSRRDDGIVIGVALFLLLAAALAGQSLWRVPFYLLALWGACAAIALIARHGDALFSRAPRCGCRRARWPCRSRWRSPVSCSSRESPDSSGRCSAADRRTTGLSDEMSPGSISKLATEYDPAFRVRFEGDAATATPRCTGAARCSTTSTASPGGARAVAVLHRRRTLAMLGEPVRYRVTLEPTNQPLAVRARHAWTRARGATCSCRTTGN